MRHLKAILGFGLALTILSGCVTTQDPFTGETKVSETAKGAGIGAVAGAALGAGGAAVAGGDKSDVAKGAAAGGILGAITGAFAGNRIDQQEARLREELQAAGVSVTRRGDNIVLNMAESLSFAAGQTSVDQRGEEVLASVAKVFIEFEDTKIDVLGHTDGSGKESRNVALSAQRAQNVANSLARKGVSASRLSATGLGSAQPILPNDTRDGRKANRRVEILIAPIA